MLVKLKSSEKNTKMAVDTLSKQSIIIGAFTIALSVILILVECSVLYVHQSWEHMTGEHHSKYLISNILNFSMYGAAAVASILLICGALKRRHLLLLPYLLCFICGLGFTTFYVGYNLMYLPFDQLEFLTTLLPIIGVETLILYTLCALFGQIRRERLNVQKQETPVQNYYDKI